MLESIDLDIFYSGKFVAVLLRNATGQVWNGSAYVNFTNDTALVAGAVFATEQGSTATFQATILSGAGTVYSLTWYWIASEGTMVVGDLENKVGSGQSPPATGLSGPSSVTLTFHDADGNPVPNVIFSVVGQGSDRASSNGVASFGLYDGTYSVIPAPTSLVLFATTTLTVSGTTALTITGTNRIPVGPPVNPAQTNAQIYTYDGQGNIEVGVTITFRLIDLDVGGSFSREDIDTAVSDSNGLLEIPLLKVSNYQAKRGVGKWVPFSTDTGDTYALPQVLSGFTPHS